MKRVSTLLVLFFLLLLAACGAAVSNTAVTSPTESVNSENGDTAVAVTSPTESVKSENGDTTVAVTSFTPAQNAAEAAQLRPDDHTQGAVEPIITIIEYGDFQ